MLDSIPGRVFVVGVILLICTIAYSSQYFIFIPALQDSFTLNTFYVLAPLNIFVFLIFYNYYLAVTTDPGRVPPHWKEPLITTTRSDPPPRFCKSCQHYKPPRTHHCSYCRRCVLKMDHHCPWINNCVGIANYPHFLRFTAYVNISCTYVLVLLIWRTRCIMDAIRHFRFDAEPRTTEVIFMVVNFVLATIVLFCVGVLSAYHFYCLARNQSTIESWERGKVATMIKRRKIPHFEYPFDLGFYKNICSVLGDNPFLWLWPNQKNKNNDGLLFTVQSHIDPRTQYLWPPRDPDDLRPSIFSSKYKRQQERKQLLKQQQQNQEIIDDNVDDSEDYYDSGSFVTDSEDEYSLTDEEQYVRKFVSDSVYNLAGVVSDDNKPHHRIRREDHPSLIKQQYRSSPSSQSSAQTPQLSSYYPGDSSDNDDNDDDDDDDTLPLSSLISRAPPAQTTRTKKED